MSKTIVKELNKVNCDLIEDVTETKINCTWIIDDFKSCLEKGEKQIISDVFPEDPNKEFRWRLVLYPKGYVDETYVAIFLNSVSSRIDYNAKIKYTVHFDNCLSKKKDMHYVEFDMHYTMMHGVKNLARRQQILDHLSDSRSGGKLKIVNSIQVVMDVSTSTTHHVFNNFKALLSNPKFSDLTLKVGSKIFKVHKNILSIRSSVFSSMLEGKQIENKKNFITISDVQENVMQEILMFIYTGKITNQSYDMLTKLLAAASKYDIYGLTSLCEVGLYKHLKEENAVLILKLADQYNVQKLKSKVLQFINDNAKAIIETQAFKEMSSPVHPAPLLVDIIRTIVTNKETK